MTGHHIRRSSPISNHHPPRTSSTCLNLSLTRAVRSCVTTTLPPTRQPRSRITLTRMSSSLSPLTLHAFPTSPNPLKVSIALELLKLPYNIKIWQFGDDPEKGVKSASFAELSENGRVPVLGASRRLCATLYSPGAMNHASQSTN